MSARQEEAAMQDTFSVGRAWALMAGLLAAVGGCAMNAKSPAGNQALIYYVAINGNDAWSGKLAAPNRRKTDGPFATPNAALAAARGFRKQLSASRDSNGSPSPLAGRAQDFILHNGFFDSPPFHARPFGRDDRGRELTRECSFGSVLAWTISGSGVAKGGESVPRGGDDLTRTLEGQAAQMRSRACYHARFLCLQRANLASLRPDLG